MGAEAKTPAGRAEYVSRVIDEEMKLLSQELGPEAKPVTTLTMRGDVNVQYRSGSLRIPEETILICGDNGSIARFGRGDLPNEKEAQRPGGNGVYYHLT